MGGFGRFLVGFGRFLVGYEEGGRFWYVFGKFLVGFKGRMKEEWRQQRRRAMREERGEERGERRKEGGWRRLVCITDLALSWTKTPVQQSGKLHRRYLLPREGGLRFGFSRAGIVSKQMFRRNIARHIKSSH